MRIFLSLIASLAIATAAHSEPYKIDKDHTQISFEVSHLGFSTFPGVFRDFRNHPRKQQPRQRRHQRRRSRTSQKRRKPRRTKRRRKRQPNQRNPRLKRQPRTRSQRPRATRSRRECMPSPVACCHFGLTHTQLIALSATVLSASF